MAAVMGTPVPATVVVTSIAPATARIIAATAMAAVTGTGTPATVVAFAAFAAAAAVFRVMLVSAHRVLLAPF